MTLRSNLLLLHLVGKQFLSYYYFFPLRRVCHGPAGHKVRPADGLQIPAADAWVAGGLRSTVTWLGGDRAARLRPDLLSSSLRTHFFRVAYTLFFQKIFKKSSKKCFKKSSKKCIHRQTDLSVGGFPNPVGNCLERTKSLILTHCSSSNTSCQIQNKW